MTLLNIALLVGSIGLLAVQVIHRIRNPRTTTPWYVLFAGCAVSLLCARRFVRQPSTADIATKVALILAAVGFFFTAIRDLRRK